jgi:hypothetical protein
VASDIKTPVGNAPLFPVILIIGGGYLAWFGIHYWRSDVKYPTTPVKSVLTGGGVPSTSAATSHLAELTADVAALQPDSGATGTTTNPAVPGTHDPGGGGGGTPAQNIALGQLLAGTYGWGSGLDWECLRTGWQEESGWSTTAAFDKADPYNHAYGIPQANPGSKMATVGPKWKTDAHTQITWGLIYIKQTYGRPSLVPHWSASGPTPGYVGY